MSLSNREILGAHSGLQTPATESLWDVGYFSEDRNPLFGIMLTQ